MQQRDRLLTAFLTASAITVSFGLAFMWNLEKPFWAGFTALVISLATIGQSLQKSLLRVIGTIGGALVGLGLLAQWEQERWVILAAISIYLMFMVFCIVRSNRNSYLFYTAVVVAVIIVLDARVGADPFMLAVARLEETLLGIAVYTVFALLFWPRSSVSQFQRSIAELIMVPHTLFSRYMVLSDSASVRDATELSEYRNAEASIDQAVALLPAVRLENYRIRRLSPQWEGFFTMLHTLLQTQRDFWLKLERVDQADSIIPNLDVQLQELAEQYSALASWRPAAEGKVKNSQDGEPLLKKSGQGQGVQENQEEQSDKVKLSDEVGRPLYMTLDEDALAKAEPHQRALWQTLRQEYDKQSQVCLALIDALIFLTAERDHQDEQAPQIPQKMPITLSQIRQVVMAGLQFWAIVLMWIYWNPPGVPSIAFAEMGIMIGMVGFLAGSGKVDPLGLFLAFALGCFAAFPLYFGIMPLMTSFSQLGVMMFMLVFAISWVFYQQRLTIVRIGLLLPWFAISGLTNEHEFAPDMFFTGVLTLLIGVFVISLIFYLFGGGHPAREFFKRQQRFDRCLTHCLSVMAQEQASPASLTWASRLRLAWNKKRLCETAPELVNISFAVDEPGLGQEKRSVKLLALSAFELTRLLPKRFTTHVQNDDNPDVLDEHIWNAALDNYRANLAGINIDRLDIRKF